MLINNLILVLSLQKHDQYAFIKTSNYRRHKIWLFLKVGGHGNINYYGTFYLCLVCLSPRSYYYDTFYLCLVCLTPHSYYYGTFYLCLVCLTPHSNYYGTSYLCLVCLSPHSSSRSSMKNPGLK